MGGVLNTTLTVTFLVCASLDWFAVATGRKKLEYVSKPLVLLPLLLGVLGYTVFSSVDFFIGALCAALLFSLAGDVFLMLPRNLFVPGLASFLLAHIAYIALFAPYVSSSLVMIAGGIFVISAGWRNGSRIVSGLDASGRERLKGPVLAYMVVITAMVLTVLATGSPWAIAGALLFYVSDTMIGWSRFVQPFRYDRLAIMVTYHLGQLGLVVGALQLYA
jgi:uncharacterized membrane protein YhhN